MKLSKADPQVAKIINQEEHRQNTQLNLIPSENITSEAVREAVGSVLMHKYSEGNIGGRYYEGNQFIDSLEDLCTIRAKKLFNTPSNWEVNVQALSGSYANLAVLLAVLEPGDKILSMYLPDGGHLSHGWSFDPGRVVDPQEPTYLPGNNKVHITAKLFNIVQYKLNPQTHLMDYDQLEQIANEHKPKLIITGGTAYPRDIDYKRIKKIAESVGALYLADIAHEAGLIAAGVLNSPVGIADIVTMTTHKTLRAARGSIILAPAAIIKRVNKAVLPGLQGGPFNNNIAGIAVGLAEALQPGFKAYTQQVVANSKALAKDLLDRGFKLITTGTDKHLVLVDLTDHPLDGRQLSKALSAAGIITNKNTIPGEPGSPNRPSGIRLGTPFITSQGFKEEHIAQIADWIKEVSEVATKWRELKFSEFKSSCLESPELAEISSQVEQYMSKILSS